MDLAGGFGTYLLLLLTIAGALVLAKRNGSAVFPGCTAPRGT